MGMDVLGVRAVSKEPSHKRQCIPAVPAHKPHAVLVHQLAHPIGLPVVLSTPAAGVRILRVPEVLDVEGDLQPFRWAHIPIDGLCPDVVSTAASCAASELAGNGAFPASAFLASVDVRHWLGRASGCRVVRCRCGREGRNEGRRQQVQLKAEVKVSRCVHDVVGNGGER